MRSSSTWEQHHAYRSESPHEDVKLACPLQYYITQACKILHSDLRAQEEKIYSGSLLMSSEKGLHNLSFYAHAIRLSDLNYFP